MPTQLADPRTMTAEDADAILEEIAHASVRIARAEARREAQINRAKTACEAETAEDRGHISTLEGRLTTFILTHPGDFTRPRMRRTPFGKYGYRKATGKAHIQDKAAVLQWAGENGYTDCIVDKPAVDKAGVLKRLRRGEDVPGAELRGGDLAEYRLDRAVMEELAK